MTRAVESAGSSKPKFPRAKRLEDFDLHALPSLPPGTLAHRAGGTWINAGEPVVLIGDSGTGKIHLLIALATAAAEAGRRVRYVTTAALVNELVEAADDKQLSRVRVSWRRLVRSGLTSASLPANNRKVAARPSTVFGRTVVPTVCR